MRVLKALLAFMATIGQWECKTVGYMDGRPNDLHCFACTFYAIRQKIAEAVTFWEEGDRADRALS